MDLGRKPASHAIQARDGGSPAIAASRSSSDIGVVKPAGGLRILVVEDQEDVRRMVATALEIEGYQVDEAANATEGLKALSRRGYHLVLSDYAMPGGTGTWMLEEAARRGLMVATAAMIVTAHPDVRELADVAVIHKPLDLDYFLDQVRRIIGTARQREPLLPLVPPISHKVELVLYISSTSAASIQARHNLEQVLAGFDASQVHCTVVDLLEDPMAGESDRIAFTPTLVKRHPSPRTWILGNLRNRQILTELLQASLIDESP